MVQRTSRRLEQAAHSDVRLALRDLRDQRRRAVDLHDLERDTGFAREAHEEVVVQPFEIAVGRRKPHRGAGPHDRDDLAELGRRSERRRSAGAEHQRQQRCALPDETWERKGVLSIAQSNPREDAWRLYPAMRASVARTAERQLRTAGARLAVDSAMPRKRRVAMRAQQAQSACESSGVTSPTAIMGACALRAPFNGGSPRIAWS